MRMAGAEEKKDEATMGLEGPGRDMLQRAR